MPATRSNSRMPTRGRPPAGTFDPVRNHFTILLRNFRREKLYTAINIAGLALGLASCLLLGLFLRSELTYDRHYPNHRNIYRVVTEITRNDKPQTLALAADAFGPM